MNDLPVVNRYGLAERLALTEVKVALYRLDSIDDLWTAFLDDVTQEEIEDQRSELDELAGRLLEALDAARGPVERLEAMFEGTSEDEIEFAIEEILKSHPEVEESYRTDLSDLLEEYSVRGLTIAACRYLKDQLPREIEAVEEKRRRLRAGELQPGDMSPGAKCALSAALLGAKALDIAMTGGGVGIVLDGALGLWSFARKWRGGCGEVAGQIWDRLND